MQIDMYAVILGMGTMVALLGLVFGTVAYLQSDAPWTIKMTLLGALYSGASAALSALFLIASFILPETSQVYDQLVANRAMHSLGLAVSVIGTILFLKGAAWLASQLGTSRHGGDPISRKITHG